MSQPASLTAPPPSPPDDLQPLAAILAFLCPGAGHFYLGHTRRAILIALGVFGMFFGGILVGGLDAVDKQENLIWFLAQACTGPTAFAVDAAHQKFFKVIDPVTKKLRSANPDEYRDPATGRPIRISITTEGVTSVTLPGTPPKTISPAYPPKARSVGRMSELGTLFAAVAGFLNLICIIDAGMNHKRVRG